MNAAEITAPHYFHFYASSLEYEQFIEAMKDAGYDKFNRGKSIYLDNGGVLIQIRQGSKDTSFSGMILPLRKRLVLDAYRKKESRIRLLIFLFGCASIILTMLMLYAQSISEVFTYNLLSVSSLISTSIFCILLFVNYRMQKTTLDLEGDSVKVEVLATIETIKIISKIIYTVSKKVEITTLSDEDKKLEKYIPKDIWNELKVAFEDSGVVSSLDIPIYRVRLPKSLKFMI
ncbi:MAG: hypothetical protein GF411_19850 [Candidatus Lokiarchaeota archaeon]|nr:hypothetical protein [Candidatus Lokiarchaeota archaeon]